MISRRIAALPDPQMRLRRLARWLAEADPDEAVRVLEQAALGAHTEANWRQLHLTLVHLLLHIRPRPPLPGGPLPLPERHLLLPEVCVAALIGAAARQELFFTARLLRDAFTHPHLVEGMMLTLHPRVEKLPLGTRREKARLPHRETLDLLMLDTTPAVVLLLAENPRITETHAVQIASLRPTHPYALQALLMPLRWLTNDKVCEALTRNSAAPPWLVLALVPLLPRRAQASVVHHPWLDTSVRALLAAWLGVDPGTLLAVSEQPQGLDIYVVDEQLLDEADSGEPGPDPA